MRAKTADIKFFGVCSISPFSHPKKIRHNLLVDVDDSSIASFAITLREIYALQPELRANPLWFEKTKHGCHIYIAAKLSRRRIYSLLRQLTFCCKDWARIGYKRGSWFLITYKPMPSNMQFWFKPMVITVSRGEWLDRHR